VQNPDEEELVELESETMFLEILKALRDLRRPMWCILLITTLTGLATFPILFFGMDWMVRKVYMGRPTFLHH